MNKTNIMENTDLNEQHIMQYFDAKFGTEIDSRMKKLREEMEELTVSEIHVFADTNENTKEEFLDEVSDVLTVITHLGHILGYTHEELLKMAYNKCKIRETNPKYKHS